MRPPRWSDRVARVLVRHDEGRLARADGARHRADQLWRSPARCGRGTRGSSSASRASRSRRIGAVRLWSLSSRGRVLVCLAYAIIDGVRPHLQRRRHARLLPAGALPRPRCAASAPAVGHWRNARVRQAMAMRRRCSMRDGADGIPGRPSIAMTIVGPTRISRASPKGSTRRTRCSCRRWTGSSRTSCSTPRATSGATSPGRGWTMCCCTFRSWSRQPAPNRRDVVLTADAAAGVVAAYGPLSARARSGRRRRRSPTSSRAFPRGAPYVLTLLAAATERPSGRSGGLRRTASTR